MSYFCDFSCLLLLLNHTLLREVFFCQNLTFIRLTLKAVYVLCALLCCIYFVKMVEALEDSFDQNDDISVSD
jgi:hypothetical protein